jgi:membrane associated rhomboid family serine protease
MNMETEPDAEEWMADAPNEAESQQRIADMIEAVAAVHQALLASKHAEYAGLTNDVQWATQPAAFEITAGSTISPIDETWVVAPWAREMVADPAAYLKIIREAWQGRPYGLVLLVTPEALSEADTARLAADSGAPVAAVHAPSLEVAAPDKLRKLIASIAGRFTPSGAGFDPGEQIRRHNVHIHEAINFPSQLRAATPRTFVVPMLLIANALVFLAMIAYGVHWWDPKAADLVRWGALDGIRVVQGEWWRLLSSNYVHIGLLHIALNMWCLWAAGRFTERLLGNAAFLIAYTLSGLGGSLASVWWNPDVIGAGASGAVFGVFGCVIGFMLIRRHTIPVLVLRPLMRSTLMFVGLNLYFGFTIPNIDNAAHIGGLVTGLLCGLALSRPIPAPSAGASRLRYALVLPVALLLLLAGWHIDARAKGHQQRTRGPRVRVRRPDRPKPPAPDRSAVELVKAAGPLVQESRHIYMMAIAVIDDASRGEMSTQTALARLAALQKRAAANHTAIGGLKSPGSQATQLKALLRMLSASHHNIIVNAQKAITDAQPDLVQHLAPQLTAAAALHHTYTREVEKLAPQPPR